jgi:hypothetical protein
VVRQWRTGPFYCDAADRKLGKPKFVTVDAGYRAQGSNGFGGHLRTDAITW